MVTTGKHPASDHASKRPVGGPRDGRATSGTTARETDVADGIRAAILRG